MTKRHYHRAPLKAEPQTTIRSSVPTVNNPVIRIRLTPFFLHNVSRHYQGCLHRRFQMYEWSGVYVEPLENWSKCRNPSMGWISSLRETRHV